MLPQARTVAFVWVEMAVCVPFLASSSAIMQWCNRRALTVAMLLCFKITRIHLDRATSTKWYIEGQTDGSLFRGDFRFYLGGLGELTLQSPK